MVSGEIQRVPGSCERWMFDGCRSRQPLLLLPIRSERVHFSNWNSRRDPLGAGLRATVETVRRFDVPCGPVVPGLLARR